MSLIVDVVSVLARHLGTGVKALKSLHISLVVVKPWCNSWCTGKRVHEVVQRTRVLGWAACPEDLVHYPPL